MAFDYDEMLAKIKDRQWALADLDWESPGAELITDEQRPKLKAFMADLVWIENVGARGFAALATKAPTETLRQIYTYFHAEEQRHASAELALMRRWGMLEDDEIPEPNINVRLAIQWLDRHADGTSLPVLGTVIPMLEVALDGALVKFLLDEVNDPLCHEVFKKINADESRHLAVDFQVLDLIGNATFRRLLIQTIGNLVQPSVLLGALMYIPLLNRMRDNIVAMGLREERLYAAMNRFTSIGERSAGTRRLLIYQVLKRHAAMVIDRGHPYHYIADFMVRLTGRIPRRLTGGTPSWSTELTHQPVSSGVEVTGLAYDEKRATWTAATTGGDMEARSVVMAAGPLANASFPDLPGIESYSGHKIHSARWDHAYDLTGKDVAVIGTGASAVQIIPELVDVAASVKVFQRTPGWVLPRLDRRRSERGKALFRRFPLAQRVARQAWFWGHEAAALGLVWVSPATTLVETVARLNLRQQVRDPWLRRQLTPRFRAGCKRMLMTSDYYPALQRDNCKLITWPIATLAENGIRTADGVEHRVDCIVFATGFDVCKTGTPFPVTGRDGRVLAEEWSGGAQAYKSVNVSGYPNLFFTFGPNSGPGHNSALVYMESQIEYAVKGIRLIIERDLRSLDVLPERQRSFNDRIQRRLTKTTWNSGCSSWYLTEDGFNATMYPGFATQYARELADLDLSDYATDR